MGRKRRLFNHVLTATVIGILAISCTKQTVLDTSCDKQDVILRIGGEEYMTKSATPDENKVTDISLMVFDDHGTLEAYRWIPYTDIHSVMQNGLSIKLATGKSYHFYGCVNFGYRVYAENIAELEKIRYHLIYPDDFRNGVPMCIIQKNIGIRPNTGTLTIHLRRLMSKISIRIDRSLLDKDVKMNVLNARIGNCPKVVNIFTDSRVSDESECFPTGYSKNEFETSAMNNYGADMISKEVSLYMLENMQGTLNEMPEGEKEFPEGDNRRKICSFAEIEIEYLSPDKASWTSPLKYRFYLGENNRDLNIRRNCHYHITIKPKNDGLSKDGWCIDKSGICTFIKDIKLSRKDINFEYEGESVLLETVITPSDATFKTLAWSSSNERVAKVSDTGIVTAVGEGVCTIKCISPDGSGAEASCEIRCKFKDYWMKLYPKDYIVGNIGDKIHIWCEYFPPNAPFDIGKEELEFDKARGIYDYAIDEDGHGVTLTLKKPGRGMLYMSTGYPINDSRMVTIEVNQP